MRLLHIHMGYEGGAERFFVTLAKALARRGHEQAALIRPGRSWTKELPAGMHVEESDYRRWWFTRFTAQAAVRRLVRDFKPDGILAWMPRAAELLPHAASCPRVTRLGDYPNPKAYWKFRQTDAIICNTPDVAAWTVRHGWTGRVEVISNFTTVARAPAALRSDHATPDDAFLVVAVGRLVKLKGYDVLIRAMAYLPSAHLWIVGEGEERPALEALARSLGLANRCHLLGWRADPSPFLAAADTVCLPSVHETLGNSVLEGLAAGKPVVATRTSGPSWILQNELSGLLVEPGDPIALTAALSRIKDNSVLSQELANAGTKVLENRFGEEAICTAYLSLFYRG